MASPGSTKVRPREANRRRFAPTPLRAARTAWQRILESTEQRESRVTSSAAIRTQQPDYRNAIAHRLGRYAVNSLHAELVLYPKPGLVSPGDDGAHLDMNAVTFMKSLRALRHYFVKVAEAGGRAAPFS